MYTADEHEYSISNPVSTAADSGLSMHVGVLMKQVRGRATEEEEHQPFSSLLPALFPSLDGSKAQKQQRWETCLREAQMLQASNKSLELCLCFKHSSLVTMLIGS